MIPSPYCVNYKIPIKAQDKGLIMQHLLVRKLTRRELEDKYLRLIDENFELKKDNHQQKEKIKILTTKLLRISKENFKYKSRDYLFLDVDNEINESDEFFRPRRAASASLRKEDNTRNSTPNLINSRFKSTEDFLHHENYLLSGRASSGANARSYTESSLEMSDSRNKEDQPGPSRSKSPELQVEIKKLKEEIDKLQKESELEKRTSTQLEVQVKELKEKLNNDKIQKELEEDIQVTELHRKITDLKAQYDKLDKESKKKLEESKKEQAELVEQLEKERIKLKRVEVQGKDLESTTKMVENLMERIAQVEKEKADLITQADRFTAVSEEISKYKMKANELQEKLEEKDKELENERSSKESIAFSQEELLTKMKKLQKENDELVVKLEGLKTENEGLLNKNMRLEERLKDLEHQNKAQLEKLNETMKVPARVLNELEKIEEIRLRQTEVSQRSYSFDPADDKPVPPVRDYALLGSQSETDPTSLTDSVRTDIHISQDSPVKSSPQPGTSLDHDTNNNSKRYLDSVPTLGEIHKMLSDEIEIEEEADEDDEDIDPKTYSIEQVNNEGAITRATKILLEQVMAQIPQTDEDDAENDAYRKLSWNKNLETKFTDVSTASALSSEVSLKVEPGKRRRKSVTIETHEDDDPWTAMTRRRSSRPSFTEENVSNLAKFLQRKSLGSVSTLSSNRSSLKSDISYDVTNWRSVQFSPDPEMQMVKTGSDQSLKVVIEIVCLQMLPSDVLSDDSIQQLYIEYTFLSYRGHLLETPQSLPKPPSTEEVLQFNYRKEFDLDFKKDTKQLKILKSMLEYNSPLPLRFLLISEPTEFDLENDEDAECEEIGFATVNLYDLVKGSASSNIERLTVIMYATRYCHEPIAQLTLQIEGIKHLSKFITD